MVTGDKDYINKNIYDPMAAPDAKALFNRGAELRSRIDTSAGAELSEIVLFAKRIFLGKE